MECEGAGSPPFGGTPGEFTWVSLRSTLRRAKELEYRSLTCKDYCLRGRKEIVEGRILVFRVDVDQSPEKSHTMASLLSDEDVSATFFYRLHSPSYDLSSPENIQIVRDVQEMGFEIGLHCEPMVMSHMTGKAPEVVIREDILRLNEIMGGEIVGVASHGDSRYKGINNIDFWRDHVPSEYGLLYEAYDKETFGLFQEGRYVSDSELVRWKSYDKGKLRIGDCRSLADHLDESKLPMYVLVHPFLFK